MLLVFKSIFDKNYSGIITKTNPNTSENRHIINRKKLIIRLNTDSIIKKCNRVLLLIITLCLIFFLLINK